MTDRENKEIHGLAVKNLYKSYTIEKNNYEVNKDINLSVPPTSLVWIYGNSGAGKSTFLNVITGIDTPDAGSVSWDGSEINTMNVNKRAQFRLEHFGLIFQFFELIKAQTIYENAALPLKITRKSKKEIDAVLFPLFDYFDVRSLIRKKPDQLSGGEKQRVVIAAAYCSEAQLFVFDEPTSGMDGEGLLSMAQWVDALAQAGKTVVIITHDELLSELACDYRIRMMAAVAIS